MEAGLQMENNDTILIVEGEVLVRAAIADYLRECGYRVMEAGSAEEAIEALLAGTVAIDIVFSDVHLPGEMNGFALSQWLRENQPEVQVILTSSIEKAAQAAGNLCESGPHLSKPYEPQQVVDWIKRLRAGVPKSWAAPNNGCALGA